ncbi:tetratricopeptide repeat protein 28-like isoform X2 [Bolinopsis microptera]|uniref:tetratricopeptide repeat protein 28-like isoform X2 n=1 Tax=Bolinopsis microptera TaxID=2820187 RepID=UPI003079B7E8
MSERGSSEAVSENESTQKDADEQKAENELMEVVLKANQACEDGLFTQAIHLYSEGLRREPQNAMVFSNRSAAYLHSNDLRAALSDADRAIRLQPTWSKGYFRKGLALQKLQDFDGSVISLAQGLAYETQSRQILSAIVETILLSNLRETFDGTQKQLRKLGLDQNPFVMLSAIGQELLSAGKFKTALSVLKSAEQVNTENLRLKGSLMSALASAHWKLGNQKQAIGYMEEDLEICRSLGDQHGECRVMGNLGNAHYTTQQYDSAIQYHKDQLLLATEIKSRKTAGMALGSLGHTYSAIGEQDQALACHEQCVALAQEMGNKVSEAEEYGNIGCIHLSKGDHSKALQYHELHLSIAQELDQLPLQTKAYFNLATLYQHIHDYSQALKCYQEILTFGVKMRSRSAEMRAYAGLGSCTRQIGELITSLNYYQQYLSIALKIPDHSAVSKAHCCLGNINQGLGRLPEALESHKNHLVKVLEQRDRMAEGRVYGNLGNVHCAMGHFNKAVKLHEQALTIAVEEGDTVSQASTNGNLGIAYQGLGEDIPALKHLDAHLTISRECQDTEGQLKALSNLGNFHANKSDFNTAQDLFQEQLEISQVRGDVEAQCKSLNSVALLYKIQGSLHSSISFAQKAVSLSANRPRLLTKNLVTLSKLYHLRGQHNDGRNALQRAYDTQTDTQTDTQHCVLVNELGGANLECGYVNSALELFSKLSDLAQDNQLFNFEMNSLAGYGKINLQNGNYVRAKEYFESAISICKERHLTKDEFYQQLSLSRVLCALRQYEDAHSSLVSAGELLPNKPNLSQDDRNMLAELSCGFGDLSLAKGDYTDALEHFKEQRNLLVGEEQIRETGSMVLCLWLLGSGYQALKILESLEDSVTEECPYVMLTVLDTRAKLNMSAGRFSEAIHQHEMRLDLIRRQGDRVKELLVLSDLANAYLVEGHFDQALVNYDQSLMISRDIDHVIGQCYALIGQAKSYFQMSEFDTCLRLCDEVDDLYKNSTLISCECRLLLARSALELNELEQCIEHARMCIEEATYSPLLLATATAILGQALVENEEEAAGHEAIVSSCSQFEIILLQRSIDFIYEQVSPIQEISYAYLYNMQHKPIDTMWVHERLLRWERARYLAPSSPFPAPHVSSQSLSDVCGALGENSVCLVVKVNTTLVHTWYLAGGQQGLCDYHQVEISDRNEFLMSSEAAEVMFGNVVSDIKRVLNTPDSLIYLVLSEDSITQPIVDQVKFQLFPSIPVSICGCVDDLSRHAHHTTPEKSLTPVVFSSHDILNQVSDLVNGRSTTRVEDLRSSHILHISADVISFSELDPDMIFIGDVSADCVILYNTGELLYEDITRISVCLLSNVRCVVTLLEVSENVLLFIETISNLLKHGRSVIEAVTSEMSLLPNPATVQCYGCDWLPRQPDYVSGVRLLLNSADDNEICPAIRATLEIIDKIKTGFNRQGPMTVQFDILGPLQGWDEILHSVGAAVFRDRVSVPEEREEGEEDWLLKTEEVRTMLTSLLDCGDDLCRELVLLLRNKNTNVVTHIADILEVYLSTSQENGPPPRLPLPTDIYTAAAALIQAIGLYDTGGVVKGSVLLTVSSETSLLRAEAALFVIKSLFDLGNAEQPYLSPADDVGAIEI